MESKQSLYRSFQENVAVIEGQIAQLESPSAVAGQQRQDAIDRILGQISSLQNDVADAAASTPSYDRRQYAEGIRSLHDKVNEAVARVTPKSRFQFKRPAGKTGGVGSASSDTDARLQHLDASRKQHGVAARTKDDDADDNDDEDGLGARSGHKAKDYNKELASHGTSCVRRPSFSRAKLISISEQKDLHIILPPLAAAQATASASLTGLRSCIVDMSRATANATSFAGLALKDLSKSLVITGRVNGPVHITGVCNSILVLVARQVRIHECRGVDLYLHCSSHPIIEDCSEMRFAPLPSCFSSDTESVTENQWDQVDDFKWLKTGHSPNWSLLTKTQQLDNLVWIKMLQSPAGSSVQQTLSQIGLPP
ncbi:hypothetical protein CDD82_2742 [Ophiocordyceps australis]|uniref:C-CAP/cofactor C-like domain-containing protein n=1 Tax=Ophiocordyceps australis TaxID=1399860 RepID=A0A2C5XTF2_9HYPO|nr:hypothetical protein CDD82_2742 [Ophiocordyceps australis]